MKTYLVVGAGGTIGMEVVRRLRAEKNVVIATVRYSQDVTPMSMLQDMGAVVHLLDDVSNRTEVEGCMSKIALHGPLDGIIYAVGHCPPQGFAEAVRYTLSMLPLETMSKEVDMYQMGPLNVFQVFLKHLRSDGCFLFISSAITRLADEKWPPFLQAHYHAAAMSAYDWLIRGMRFDERVQARAIKVHRLAPAAVDTPFHDCDGFPKPPVLIPVETVVGEVVKALQSDTVVDREVLDPMGVEVPA